MLRRVLRQNLSLPVAAFAAGALILHNTPNPVHAHGEVTPQAVDTTGLPDLGEDWLEENPWRDPTHEKWALAIKIGASGYNQNCARCHGLGGVSGGLSPDLRFLSADPDGDEWFVERFSAGYTQNGITKMPAFGELLGQEAAWAIRTYLETRPDADSLETHSGDLTALRDRLKEMNDSHLETPELKEIREKLSEISKKIETGSGAPVSDSPASQAVILLDGSKDSIRKAAEALTIGLSAAKE